MCRVLTRQDAGSAKSLSHASVACSHIIFWVIEKSVSFQINALPFRRENKTPHEKLVIWSPEKVKDLIGFYYF